MGSAEDSRELLKLGSKVSESTVARHLRRLRPRSGKADQRWTTFLANHREVLVAFDFFTGGDHNVVGSRRRSASSLWLERSRIKAPSRLHRTLCGVLATHTMQLRSDAINHRSMKIGTMLILTALLGFVVISPASAQNAGDEQNIQTHSKVKTTKKGRSAGGDVASGSGKIGAGAAKGTGRAAEGVGKGAADLATLHPVNAAGDVGKGGASAGKDVAVGTGKGTAKVVKGIGKGIKHIF